MTAQVFPIPNAGGTTALGAILLLPVALSALLALIFWPRSLQIEVEPRELKIRGSVYGRSIPRRDLDLEQARRVDLEREPGLSPVRRSNGVSLSNYRVGWFRLRNGQRALCFLTQRDRVLYLPTKVGYVLLLSLDQPEQLLSALAT